MSRRLRKSVPSAALERFGSPRAEMMGTGTSGTLGGVIFAIGDTATSSSSTAHRQNLASARYSIERVAGLTRARRAPR